MSDKSAKGIGKGQTKKKKILFIEDEPDQVMMIRLRLERNGFWVVTASDGLEGFEMALSEKPDLILLDVIMPGMDGLELCRKFREETATKKLPIITTTAAGIDDIEQECFLAGADDCVRKPYDSVDLIMKINRLLDR